MRRTRRFDSSADRLILRVLHSSVLNTGFTGSRWVRMDTSIKDFEAAIAELDSIVKKLEEGDLPLEQSLALYERGVQLSRFCHARLEEAERRIEILSERGELKPAPASLTGDGESMEAPAGRRDRS
jgi:exodeoxyribonuclease VII small subunit